MAISRQQRFICAPLVTWIRAVGVGLCFLVAGPALAFDRYDDYTHEARLTTTFGIHFENFTTVEALELIEIMEDEFPYYVRSTSIDGTAHRGHFGYVTRASGSRLFRWINVALTEMGLDPDYDIQVITQGTTLTLRKLGVDEPSHWEFDGRSRFN